MVEAANPSSREKYFCILTKRKDSQEQQGYPAESWKSRARFTRAIFQGEYYAAEISGMPAVIHNLARAGLLAAGREIINQVNHLE